MTLILIRHGQSTWNKEGKFTGWVDVPLTAQGEAEAHEAGVLLRENNLIPDVVFTSLLRRAIDTSLIVLNELDRAWIPTQRSWRLNERHYGGLAGLDKAATTEKYGEEKIFEWRRSYSTRPPEDLTQKELLGRDPRYTSLYKDELPVGESLADVEARLMPYWKTILLPRIANGENVMIVAHGNSLRALVKNLDNLSDDDVAKLEIPTGEPRIYEFDNKNQVLSCTILNLGKGTPSH